MTHAAAAAAPVISLQGLFIAIPLVAIVLLVARVYTKNAKKRRQKPGMHLLYTVPGHTAAQCRALLGTPAPDDIFTYKLESAASGGWYIHFTLHNPTGQTLDTLYLLQFEGDDPAVLSAHFVREAFGMKEPVIGEELLNAFFAQKLGALRSHPPQDNEL